MSVLASLHKYEVYKDSGFQWFGKVPEHWVLERGKWLFKKAERAVRVDDEIVTCFRDGEVTLRKNRRIEGFTNALKEHGYQGIKKGDFVIHAMDAFAGAIGVSDSDGKSTPVYSVCIPRKANTVNSSFYAYLMRSLALSGFIESLAKGIRERSTNFRFSDFSELELLLPPIEEQSAIANFLDRKTAQIDQEIAIKEKQIELLKERKQILIQNAVTRGLDPDVPMKDSGVEWIGEIPEHWELKKLKYTLDLLSEKQSSLNSKFSYLGMESIESWTGKYIFSDSEADGLANRFREGNILFGKLRPYLAKVYLCESEGICSTEFLVYKCKSCISEYFSYLLRSSTFISLIDASTYGTKMPRANSDFIGKQQLAIPPDFEQERIVEYINDGVEKIDKAISFQQAQIEKLKEYKSTLINSAVTGKIKVT